VEKQIRALESSRVELSFGGEFSQEDGKGNARRGGSRGRLGDRLRAGTSALSAGGKKKKRKKRRKK
jgi:hypothetical protein